MESTSQVDPAHLAIGATPPRRAPRHRHSRPPTAGILRLQRDPLDPVHLAASATPQRRVPRHPSGERLDFPGGLIAQLESHRSQPARTPTRCPGMSGSSCSSSRTGSITLFLLPSGSPHYIPACGFVRSRELWLWGSFSFSNCSVIDVISLRSATVVPEVRHCCSLSWKIYNR